MSRPVSATRERVRILVEMGCDTREIAEVLGLGNGAVNYHRRMLAGGRRRAVRVEPRPVRVKTRDRVRELLARGMSDREIAAQLGFRLDTVRHHRRVIDGPRTSSGVRSVWRESPKRRAPTPRPKAVVVQARRRTGPPAEPRLAVAPLLDALRRYAAARGRSVRSLTTMAADRFGTTPEAEYRRLCRAIEDGALTVATADRWACALGRHPFDLWGDDWYSVA